MDRRAYDLTQDLAREKEHPSSARAELEGCQQELHSVEDRLRLTTAERNSFIEQFHQARETSREAELVNQRVLSEWEQMR